MVLIHSFESIELVPVGTLHYPSSKLCIIFIDTYCCWSIRYSLYKMQIFTSS